MENKDIDIVPIHGNTKLNRLEENFNSCKINLTVEEVKAIDQSLNAMKMDLYKGSNKK